MPSSTHSLTARLLTLALCLAALAACSADPPATPADAAVDAAPIEDVSVDVAPDVAPPDASPDVPRDVAPDAPTTCVDVSGAWEWAWECPNANWAIRPSSCYVQSGCTLEDFFDRPATLVGNTATRRLVREVDGVGGIVTAVFNGDTAALELNLSTLPLVCRGTGRRVTFPGASRYCCNVGRDDCGAGRRCSPIAATTEGRVFSACVADGVTAAGADCSRAAERVGADRCVAGQTCSEDYPTSATQRVCQRLCAVEGQCGADELCRAYTRQPSVGVCHRRCTLRGNECPAESTCRPVAALGASEFGQAEYVAGCDRTGPRGAGMACARNDECGAGMACAQHDDLCFASLVCGRFVPQTRTCRPVCDETRPCPAGSECVPFRSFDATAAANTTGLGACVPM